MVFDEWFDGGRTFFGGFDNSLGGAKETTVDEKPANEKISLGRLMVWMSGSSGNGWNLQLLLHGHRSLLPLQLLHHSD